MKLVILYGHYRSFDKTVLSWISSLEGCDYEFRFITFNTIDHCTKCWWHDNTKESPELTSSQLELLKKYDPNTKIIRQEFTKDELDDIYASLPLKVYIYKFNNIQEVLSSIDDKKYDMIILSRFDILIHTIKFKDISVEKSDIKIGARISNHFKGFAASDLLCVFHPADKSKFYNMPKDIVTRRLKFPEECYNEFYYDNFTNVRHVWHYDKDFVILRL